jgi:hypothetical protein
VAVCTFPPRRHSEGHDGNTDDACANRATFNLSLVSVRSQLKAKQCHLEQRDIGSYRENVGDEYGGNLSVGISIVASNFRQWGKR